tara:strand:- start:1885 stop:2112 length:228 start_codon:yes stop_codon:yes gene_type:complete
MNNENLSLEVIVNIEYHLKACQPCTVNSIAKFLDDQGPELSRKELDDVLTSMENRGLIKQYGDVQLLGRCFNWNA